MQDILGFLLKEGCVFTIDSHKYSQPQYITTYFHHLILPFATTLVIPISSYLSEKWLTGIL